MYENTMEVGDTCLWPAHSSWPSRPAAGHAACPAACKLAIPSSPQAPSRQLDRCSTAVKGDSPIELGGEWKHPCVQPTPDAERAPSSNDGIPQVSSQQSPCIAYQEPLPSHQDSFAHWSHLHGNSGFTEVGRPWLYPVTKRRVWSRDVPPRWRRLKCKAPRGVPAMEPSEVAAILAGGFWQPSVSAHASTTGPQGLHGLSKFMQARMRVLQQEAEEVVQLLRDSRKRITASISCSTTNISRGTGAVLAGGWRLLRRACCCGLDQALVSAEEDQDLQGQYSAMHDDTMAGGSDEDSHVECDAASDNAMHEMAEAALQYRMRTHMSAAAQAVLLWGRADPLRSPLLPHADSAAELGSRREGRGRSWLGPQSSHGSG